MATDERTRKPCTTIIMGFHQDADGDWIAELACGHTQHMRHRPPWEQRPWVSNEAGRAMKVGKPIECPSCEMPEPPASASEVRRTASFTETTIPEGLLREHRTPPGVWAKIVVEAGSLEYTLDSPPRTFLLAPERAGVAPPTAAHHVKVVGPVRFHVELLKEQGGTVQLTRVP